jgi:hypothetical protein
MPVIKINRKVFGPSSYDISHNVTGALNLTSRTSVYIDSGSFLGAGEYRLLTYSTLSLSPSLVSVRSALNITTYNNNYEAYAYISGSAIFASIVDTSTINKDHIQTLDNGLLTIAGPTSIELDSSIFNAAGSYALFDYRLGDISGSLSDITVSISGSTTLTASSPSIFGPYIITTLS